MYGKIFASMYQGTLRGRKHELLVFTNLIASADAHGWVDKHWRAIADETGLTVQEVKDAIAILESSDLESRSSELEGKRLTRMDDHREWGWLIVNYAKYRAIRSEEDRRIQNRKAQAEYRKRRQQPSSAVSNSKPPSAVVSQGKPESAQAEADGEAEAKADAEGIKDNMSACADCAPALEGKEAVEGSKRKAGYHQDARAVLHILNEAAGIRYREVDSNLGIISARLAEPEVTFEGVKAMIQRQAVKWPAGDKMREYLRPATLFCKSKFDAYYAAKDMPIVNENTQTKQPHQAESNLAKDTTLKVKILNFT